jgi:regulator of PEP synthase PpsR (kinase-PPPase family)
MAKRKTPTIFLVSDGRAETAARVLQAAAVQFQGAEYKSVRRRDIRTPEAVRRVVQEAEKAGAIIFFTLVGTETRKAMQQSMGRNIEIIDLLGPVITALHSRFQREPGAIPGLLYDLERDHYDRMTAFDFVLTHDDGQRIHELSRADVVITGVS